MGRISSGNLMNYITFIKNLEVSVFEQQRVLDSLQNGIVTSYSKKDFKEKEKHISLLAGLFGWCIFCSISIAVVSAIIAFFCNYKFGSIITSLFIEDELFDPIGKAMKKGFFIGLAIGVPLAVITWMMDISDVKKKNQEISQYNAEADRDNHHMH